jgi:hypothetical protein
VLAASVIPLRLLVDKPGLAVMEHARLGRYYLLKGQHALAAAEYLSALRLLEPGQEGAGQGSPEQKGAGPTGPEPSAPASVGLESANSDSANPGLANSSQSGSGAAAGPDPAELRAGLAASLLLGGKDAAQRP